MEAKVIVLTPEQVKQIVSEAIDTAMLKYRQSNLISEELSSQPFGDLKWLYSIWPIPDNTIEQVSARGDIPGKIKIGKRVIYDKATVINWIREHYCRGSSTSEYEEMATNQYNKRQRKSDVHIK